MEGIPSCVTITYWSGAPGVLMVMVAVRSMVLALGSQVTVKESPFAPDVGATFAHGWSLDAVQPVMLVETTTGWPAAAL